MLGLSLAFILSQDQTLRCIKVLKFCLKIIPVFGNFQGITLYYLFYLFFNIFKELAFVTFRFKSGCKDKRFCLTFTRKTFTFFSLRFNLNQNPHHHFKNVAPVSRSGCKDREFNSKFASIFSNFFSEVIFCVPHKCRRFKDQFLKGFPLKAAAKIRKTFP